MSSTRTHCAKSWRNKNDSLRRCDITRKPWYFPGAKPVSPYLYIIVIFFCYYLHLGGVQGSLSFWELQMESSGRYPHGAHAAIFTFRSRPVFITQGRWTSKHSWGGSILIRKEKL